MAITKSLTDEKVDLLIEELAAGLTLSGNLQFSVTGDSLIVHNGDAIESEIDSIIAAHDKDVLTDEQKVEQAALIAIQNGKQYLRQQLLNASPNVTTIYNTIKTHVDSNTYLSQIVDNQVALMSTSLGWVLNLETPTPQDRMRYILAVEQVIALLA